MSSTAKLEASIEALNSDIQLLEGKVAGFPDDFALKMSLDSLKSHRADLQTQLRDEKLRRECEIIELRFKGKSVHQGSIPLLLMGNLSRFWSEMILSGANQLRFGQKAKRKVPKEIIDTLDLRLAGISHGSTKLFITGKNAPDLFGNSMLETTLQQAFALLSAETGEQLTDRVSVLGKRSAQSLDHFLKTVTSHELELDLTWNSPSERSFEWNGNTEKMLQLSNSLESLVEAEPEEIKFRGQLVTISMKGTFEIEDESEIAFKGTFPTDMLEQMKEFHIGQRCSGVLLKKKLVNRVSGYEKAYYSLKKIKS